MSLSLSPSVSFSKPKEDFPTVLTSSSGTNKISFSLFFLKPEDAQHLLAYLKQVMPPHILHGPQVPIICSVQS